ncbi:hypothetical protein D3C76_1150150 [compost metagenome]
MLWSQTCTWSLFTISQSRIENLYTFLYWNNHLNSSCFPLIGFLTSSLCFSAEPHVDLWSCQIPTHCCRQLIRMNPLHNWGSAECSLLAPLCSAESVTRTASIRTQKPAVSNKETAGYPSAVPLFLTHQLSLITSLKAASSSSSRFKLACQLKSGKVR